MQAGHFPYTGSLEPADAAAVVLTIEDGRYVMQLRDDKPGIFYPGHFGLFGGAIEGDETFEQAAVRELEEELSLHLPGRLTFLTRMTLGFEPIGQKSVERVFYTAQLSEDEIVGIRVGEGQGYDLVAAEPLLLQRRVVPYDAFAIWLHCNAITRSEG